MGRFTPLDLKSCPLRGWPLLAGGNSYEYRLVKRWETPELPAALSRITLIHMERIMRVDWSGLAGPLVENVDEALGQLLVPRLGPAPVSIATS